MTRLLARLLLAADPTRHHALHPGPPRAWARALSVRGGADARPLPHPLLCAVHGLRGLRPYMEDDHFVASDGRFVAVFDGHGGADVARYLRAATFSHVVNALPRLEDDDGGTSAVLDVAAAADAAAVAGLVGGGAVLSEAELAGLGLQLPGALRSGLARVDADVLSVGRWTHQGSTAVAVAVHAGLVFAANVGDSRAVLSAHGGAAVELTRDHKPDDAAERARVEALGGSVDWHGFRDDRGEPMEGTGVWRINGNLAVARAIGDGHERPFVSAEAECTVRSLQEGDEFILLASDGLWDVMTSEEAVAFVHETLDDAEGALRSGSIEFPTDSEAGVSSAVVRAKRAMARTVAVEAARLGSSDNITVSIVWL